MPADYRFRFDDDKGISPSGPKTMNQNPKHPILVPQPRARMFPLQYRRLLAECNDLKTEAVTGTKEGAKARNQANEKRNHEPGYIAQGGMIMFALTA